MKDPTYQERVLKEFRDGVEQLGYDKQGIDDLCDWFSRALDGQLAEIRETVAGLIVAHEGTQGAAQNHRRVHNDAIREALALIPNPSKEK